MIEFDINKTSLRKIVEGLAGIGYEPTLHLDSLYKKERRKSNRERIMRIGVAGFCFGNIMLLSFPEYFSSGTNIDAELKKFFSYLILILSVPVFFYSASEFFIKAYRSLIQRSVSIDVPIALGIAAILIRSSYEILTRTGAGYFDSGSGLVFFMLIGRWFQDFTFDAMSFERDYRSYFPIAVTRIINGIERSVAVNELEVNDRILIRNNEIIPVDAVLRNGTAEIDYSFVTGESLPVIINQGDMIFAGGKQLGPAIELVVARKLLQSHLTQLWNKESDQSSPSGFEKLVTVISRYFIVVTILIAIVAAIYWWNTDHRKAINAFTAVLVIACPCALALSAPFTYGNIIRILGKRKIYLRNSAVLERLADIDTIVFDKTGTLTDSRIALIDFIGDELSETELQMMVSLLRNSTHPLSKLLVKHFMTSHCFPVSDYKEIAGQGIEGIVQGIRVKAGSLGYVAGISEDQQGKTQVYISFNDDCKGYYSIRNSYRSGLKFLIQELTRRKFSLAVLTGDGDSEKSKLENIFSGSAQLNFRQTPENKLMFVKRLQADHLHVLMIGDGLNDAGALKQSDVGISIADDTNNFTPSSDAIMDAKQLCNLHKLICFSRSAYRIITWSFVISLLYNFVGLSFAVSGTLSPVLAAILMPISTVSLVLFAVIASTLKAKSLNFA